jgi:hypothetical protein
MYGTLTCPDCKTVLKEGEYNVLHNVLHCKSIRCLACGGARNVLLYMQGAETPPPFTPNERIKNARALVFINQRTL